MRYGQTLFASSAVAGLVTAAGVALCFANATGKQEVAKLAYGTASAYATASARPYNVVVAQPVEAKAYATVVGHLVVTYKVSGLAQAICSVSGKPKVNYFVRSSATATAMVSGRSVRLTREYPYHADATAEGYGKGDIWNVAFAAPALAYATAFGTTYNVGQGSLTARATLVGNAKQEVGMRGEGICTADATGSPRFNLGGLGTALGEAIGFADAGVKRGDTRYFEGFGVANAYAKAVVTYVSVWQGQTARCYATLQGTAQYIIGVKGRALCTATWTADPFASQTGATGDPAATTATAYGKALVTFGAKGQALPKATGTMVTDAVVKSTRVSGTSVARATIVTGIALVQKQVYGSANPTATCVGKGEITKTVSGVGAISCTLKINQLMLSVRGAYLSAYAKLYGTALKTENGRGQANGVATGMGYNQINDLVKAPEDRTVYLEAQERLTIVDLESRTIIV